MSEPPLAHKLDGRKVRAVVSGPIADFTKSGDNTTNDTASLGVIDGVLDLSEIREKLGNEEWDCDLRFNELSHGVRRETNVVAERRPIVQSTFSEGLIKESIKAGIKRLISSFEIQCSGLSRVARAAFFMSVSV